MHWAEGSCSSQVHFFWNNKLFQWLSVLPMYSVWPNNQCMLLCAHPVCWKNPSPRRFDGRAFPQTEAEVNQGKPIVVNALKNLALCHTDLDSMSLKSSFGTNAYSLREKPTPIAPNPVQTPPHIKGLKQQIQVLQSSVQSLQTKTKHHCQRLKGRVKVDCGECNSQGREQVFEETSKGIAGNIACKRDKKWKS